MKIDKNTKENIMKISSDFRLLLILSRKKYNLKVLLFIFALILLSGFPGVLKSYDLFDTRGKEFWLAFTPNYHQTVENDSLYIYISSQYATKGQIVGRKYNNQIEKIDFNITAPNKTLTFRFSPRDYEIVGTAGTHAYPSQDETVSNQYFKITADTNISVYALTQSTMSSDATIVLPIKALDVNYMILTYPSDCFDLNQNEDTPCQFAILATENNTNVKINLSDASTNKAKNDSISINLNAGDSYLVQGSLMKYYSDLSGTLIQSDKKIAVFSGHQRATIPLNSDQSRRSSRDCLYEQLTPVKVWGENSLIPPLPHLNNETATGNDKFRILAYYDSTTVNINGISVKLNKGEFYEGDLITAQVVTANRPILAASFKKTSSYSSYDISDGDPLMLLNPPKEQYVNSYLVINAQSVDKSQGTQKAFTHQYIVVTIPDTGIATLKMDNSPVNNSLFTAIGTTGYSYAQLQVADGTHSLNSNADFGVFVCGFGPANSYGYLGGMSVKPMDFDPPVIKIAGSCQSISGIISDSSSSDMGISSIVSPLDSDTNCTVTIDSFVQEARNVKFSVSVTDPSKDACYIIIATDIMGNKKIYKDYIAGNTIEILSFGSSTNNNQIDLGSFPIGTLACDSLKIHNYGAFPKILKIFSDFR